MKIPFISNLFNRQFRNTSFEVWFLQKTTKGYIVLDKKKLKLDKKQQKTMVSYKNKTFFIPEEASLEDKFKQVIMFDFDNEKIIAFKKIKLGYSATLIDQLLVKQIIAQITQRIKSAIGEQTKSKIGMLIIVGVAGALTGYIIGTMYPLQNAKMMMMLRWL